MEIKFRGKRIDNGEWIEGYYGKLLDPNGNGEQEKHFIMQQTINFNPKTSVYFTDYEVEAETVGQFTSLDDMNYNDLYFGDIVQIYYGKRHDLTKTIKNINDLFYLKLCIEEHGANFIIIGDEHRNPELLEDTHD